MSDALLRISFGGEISNCSVITYGKPTFQFEFNDMDQLNIKRMECLESRMISSAKMMICTTKGYNRCLRMSVISKTLLH